MVAHNFNTNTLEAKVDLWDQPGLQRTSNDSLKYPLRVCLPRPPKVVNRNLKSLLTNKQSTMGKTTAFITESLGYL